MTNDSPYNPLDKLNLGRSVTEAILAKTVVPLGDVPTVKGAGIYVIYYTGDFEVYAPIARANQRDRFAWPIYVGKAIPSGGRKGKSVADAVLGTALKSRLAEHAESVDAATNLDVADFHCQYLTVDDIWIPLAESLLIEQLRPLWNQALDGFGNHDPGDGRKDQKRSPWDAVHPGRAWAVKLKPSKLSPDILLERLRENVAKLAAEREFGR